MKHVYVVVEVGLGGDQAFLGVYPTSEDAQQALYEGELYNHISAEIIEAPLGGGEFRWLSHPSGLSRAERSRPSDGGVPVRPRRSREMSVG